MCITGSEFEMLRNANSIQDGSILSADVCIIGAGPAGIAIAYAFAGHNARVICLESGGIEAEDRAQQLNEGAFIGSSYKGLRGTRHRQVGGTACIWNTPLNGDVGAKYVPLDCCDFETRSEGIYPGWPIDRADIDLFYERAQSFCGLGPFTYDGSDWCKADETFDLPDQRVRRAVYQFGPSSAITDHRLGQVCASENTDLLFNATACALTLRGAKRSSATVSVKTFSGGRLTVEARFAIIAGGAIENARLLMVSREPGKEAPGDSHGWLGRCFMEHPRDYSLSLAPRGSDIFALAGFFDRHRADDGTIIAGRLACDPHTIIGQDLPNASLTILPLLRPSGLPSRLFEPVTRRVRRWLDLSVPAGHGWSEVTRPERHYIGLRFILNVEQWPHKDNHIRLGNDRDQFGVPKPEVHWHWRASDQKKLSRVRAVFAEALQAADIGEVRIRDDSKPDPSAHHHAGTTRMHTDYRLGVVDSDCRVHETDNLYVAGASVFPTAGYANPTLTTVALALRLADHLKTRL